jgi:hypothetical protein
MGFNTRAVREILAHLGEPTSPPRTAPARGPLLWEMADAGQGEFDPQAQPAPDYEFDQRMAWQRQHEDDPIWIVGDRLCHGSPRAASSAPAVTHSPTRPATLARFSGSVGTRSPNHDGCQGLSEPGTLAEVALDLLSLTWILSCRHPFQPMEKQHATQSRCLQ